jgi:hypothetical protein
VAIIARRQRKPLLDQTLGKELDLYAKGEKKLESRGLHRSVQLMT